MGVIWLHTWIGTPQVAWLVRIPILRSGGFGVDIFFALSGFLITTLLLREEERFGSISLRSFYVRRALRIWPLYYTVLAGYVILTLLTAQGEPRAAFFQNRSESVVFPDDTCAHQKRQNEPLRP
jgi:peptidoglycan/LPS O-acetylase OafA/YrhL